MVDNQLKHAEDALHELEAIRGSKIDARGVEVQGVLDSAGAHTMKVFIKHADGRRPTSRKRGLGVQPTKREAPLSFNIGVPAAVNSTTPLLKRRRRKPVGCCREYRVSFRVQECRVFLHRSIGSKYRAECFWRRRWSG